jgi:hypothetical protein
MDGAAALTPIIDGVARKSSKAASKDGIQNCEGQMAYNKLDKKLWEM